MKRIALIHALAHSVAPANAEFERQWPQARRMNLLDDSLSADLADAGALDQTMTARFITLADYAVASGADGILFTCSAFGPCIEAAARRHAAIPVLKPNEALIDALKPLGGRIGLLATFGPTLQSMPAEFPTDMALDTELATGALEALNRGDAEGHDERAVAAAVALAERGCSVIALAQFSLARACDAIAQRTGLPVLTTLDTAVRRLRTQLSP